MARALAASGREADAERLVARALAMDPADADARSLAAKPREPTGARGGVVEALRAAWSRWRGR
jgi:hypothetical protein